MGNRMGHSLANTDFDNAVSIVVNRKQRIIFLLFLVEILGSELVNRQQHSTPLKTDS